MLNHIVLMGRLTRDPEIRHTQAGLPVASFSLAVERDYGQRGTNERQTDFIDIVAWRSTAEFVGKYFTKGQLVAVSGRLQIRDWTDNNGGKRRSAEVVADNVYFAEAKRDRSQQSGQGQYGQQPYNYAPPAYEPEPQYPAYNTPVSGSDFAELDDDDGDLPF